MSWLAFESMSSSATARRVPPRRRSASWLAALFAAAFAFGSAHGSAHAQGRPRPGSAEADRRALALYEEGSAAFTREDYSTAAARFEAAFALSPRPRILYNLGVTYDRLGMPQQALDAFERYLHQLPNAPERAQVEERIRVLRADAEFAREQAQQSNAAASASAHSAEPRTIVNERVVVRPGNEPSHTGRTVGFVLGAFALAAGATSGGVAGFSLSFYETLRRTCGDLAHMRDPSLPWCGPELISEVQLRATLVNVLMFSAIGLGIASGISFAVDAAQPRHARAAPSSAALRSVLLVPSTDGATIALGGRF
jgi:tetratricopeptide (TPR) repeat protein